MVLLVIVGLVMAIASVLFALQNAAVVSMNFGIWQLEQSLAVVLIGTLGLGIIISMLLSLPTILRRGWQNSQQKNKIEQLKQQLKVKSQTTLEQQQSSLAQQESVQELLQAFSFIEEVTGVLNQETTVKLTEYLLGQIQQHRKNPRYSSLVVMLFSVDPAKSNLNFADIGSENAVYKAIAKRFKNTITADSFLGITERKRFISLVLGFKGIEVSEYVAFLQNAMTESPLQKADGVLLPIKMSVGGVVVDPTDAIDGRNILQQAEQNLEISLTKGRGYAEISEINLKSI